MPKTYVQNDLVEAFQEEHGEAESTKTHGEYTVLYYEDIPKGLAKYYSKKRYWATVAESKEEAFEEYGRAYIPPPARKSREEEEPPEEEEEDEEPSEEEEQEGEDEDEEDEEEEEEEEEPSSEPSEEEDSESSS